MSKLIINADDFGLHSAINKGIIVWHTKGISKVGCRYSHSFSRRNRTCK